MFKTAFISLALLLVGFPALGATVTHTVGNCKFIYDANEYNAYQLISVERVWDTFYSCNEPDQTTLTLIVAKARDLGGKETGTTVFGVKGINDAVLSEMATKYGIYWNGAVELLANDFRNRFCIRLEGDKAKPVVFCSK